MKGPAIAAQLGADVLLNAPDEQSVAAVEADVVIESSGNHFGLASAINGDVRGGRVVMVGMLPAGTQPVAFHWRSPVNLSWWVLTASMLK